MPILNIFLIVGLIALVFSFFQRKSLIWGGATIGLITGIIVGIVKRDFSDILRFALVGADIGLFFTIFYFVGDRLIKRNS